MKITWEQVNDTTWIGRSPQLRFAQMIQFSTKFDLFFVIRTKMAYKTLQAAKIAVAKTAKKNDVQW